MMKKTISLVLVMLVISLCGITVFADDTPGFVTDAAGLLNVSQIEELAGYGKSIADEYGCGVYLVTVDSYTDYDSGSVEDAAEAIYQYYDLGIGSEKNGIMLLLSMQEREYDLCAFGDTANAAFTDYGKTVLEDEFLDDFVDDDWYSGFCDYYTESEYLLQQNANGAPVDIWIPDEPVSNPDSYYLSLFGKQIPKKTFYIVAVGVPLFIALIVCLIMRGMMKNVRPARSARSYLDENGVVLTGARDNFLYVTQSRIKIEQNRSSGGGHFGGTSINSGGFSHRSGKF